jgi:hypothetical protein
MRTKPICSLCNSTDQVQVKTLTPKEEVARFELQLGEAEELVSTGLCAKCRALPRDELLAHLEMALRNRCVDYLPASGLSPDIARDFVDSGPTSQLRAMMRHAGDRERGE